MTARNPKLTDSEEALLVEQSKALIREMDKLIARARQLTAEHRQVTEALRLKRQAEKNPGEEPKD